MQENFILRDSVICDYSDRLLGIIAAGLKLVVVSAAPYNWIHGRMSAAGHDPKGSD
jgi:hypothetical protein